MTVNVRAADLLAAIDRVRSTANGSVKPPMGCVLLDAAHGRLRVVATDRRRLAVSEIPVVDGGSATLRALVAIADVTELGALGAVVDLAVAATHLCVGGAHSAPLVAGEFPDYEQLLAADPDAATAVVDRSVLLAAIEDVADDEPLRLRLDAGAVEVGESPVRVDGRYAGPDVSVLLDAGFAHDAVAAAPGTELAVEVSGPTKPVVFRATASDGYTCLVMPVRVATPRPKRARA